jgi:membrane-associated protease RseP (regulator of RpoE activity)
MKSVTRTWLLAGCLGVLIAAYPTDPLWAQPELNKIEAKIRQQSKQPDNQPATGTAENPPAEIIAPPATAVDAPPRLPQPPQPEPSNSGGRPAPTRTYLGITANEPGHGGGVHLLGVHPGGPGDKAGLQVGDTVLSLGGMRITQMSDLANLLDIYKPGDKVVLEIFRDGQMKKVDLTLGLRPSPAEIAAEPATPRPPLRPSLSTLPPQPRVMVSPSGDGPALALPQPVANPGPVLPPPPPDALQIEQLQQRIDRLERRLDRLEREQSAKTR